MYGWPLVFFRVGERETETGGREEEGDELERQRDSTMLI